ncbi:MAG: glycine cleavage system protein GcvH [Anaerolineae bacterium]|nr:glycine cleavage system protein GcvH [Anaerolineae bacterium]
MSKIDHSAHYLSSHEWVRAADGGEWIFGISDHAQEALSDIVYVELPRVGKKLQAGDTFGVVESVKAASDVYAPISGTVVAINDALEGDPAQINADPYGDGWLVRVKSDSTPDLSNLLTPDAYATLLSNEEG